MKYSKKIAIVAWVALPLLMGACGSRKAVTDNPVTPQQGTATTTPTAPATPTVPAADKAAHLALVRKVIDNAAKAQNIVSSIDFNIKSGKKDITVDGKICMRRDEVIRIQLSPMGLVEVGRLEFTRDSVLIMDRMHKQYLKSSYDQVSFLKNNGIDFYALQSLFWNQLFEPGTRTVTAGQAEAFEVDGNDISLAQGKLKFTCETEDVTFVLSRRPQPVMTAAARAPRRSSGNTATSSRLSAKCFPPTSPSPSRPVLREAKKRLM